MTKGEKEPKSDRDARQRLLDLEQRIRGAPPALPQYFFQLQMRIHQILEQACMSGRLKNNFRELTKPLYEYTKPDEKGVAVIDGGARAERWTATNQFRRDDGACFNFFVMVRYPPPTASPELIAYHFNLAFPDGRAPSFVRFDLNEAEYAKPEERDALQSPLLCHVHPGRSKMTIPTPLLAPWEILDLLLYEHLRRPIRFPVRNATVSPDRAGVRWKNFALRYRRSRW
jgi:hypothetical protein